MLLLAGGLSPRVDMYHRCVAFLPLSTSNISLKWRCVHSIKSLPPSVLAQHEIPAAFWILIELPEVILHPIRLQSACSDCGPSLTNHLRHSDEMEEKKKKSGKKTYLALLIMQESTQCKDSVAK